MNDPENDTHLPHPGTAALLQWLDASEADERQLSRWLQGYDPPPLTSEEEPYLWLLEAIPKGRDHNRRRIQLAERVRRLLESQPDVNRPGDMPLRLLYNLLFLCSGVNAPDQLAEPLYSLYKRRALEGEWLGVRLYDALMSALIPNQLDNRLYDCWKRMLEGEQVEPFYGNLYDGFEGVLWMPKSELTRGQPDIDAIGHALLVMTRHLDQTPNGKTPFAHLLENVQDVYLHQHWELDFLELANVYNWPRWAVESLPDLSFELDEAVDAELCPEIRGQHQPCTRMFLWWPYNEVLKAGEEVADYWYVPEKSLCDDQVFQVIVPPMERKLIEDLAIFVEPYRIDNPYSSESSTVGNIADAMSAFELKHQGDQRVRIIQRAHRHILQDGEILAFNH